jgi:hypothetical protein
MSKPRASIFEDGEVQELDIAAFAPKTSTDAKAPGAEQVRAVSQAAKFLSREPATPKPEAKVKRAARRYRTGRNVQFNVKASQETVDAIYALTEANKGWVLGYTLERAIAALQRELEHEKSQ